MLRVGTSATGHVTEVDDSSPFGKLSLVTTILHLWPYIWPKGRPELERRVLYCFALLVFGKFVNALVPFTFKWATDALQGHLDASAPTLLMGAAGFTVLYGLLRALYALLTQARDALFAAVAMHAVKKLAIDVFDHMHRLSMRYHVSRKTGGLTRVLERGRDAIETLARLVMSTGLPTIVEFLLVLGIFAWQFNWRYSLVAATTIFVYLGYTTFATNWRIGIRRKMNDSDVDANVKAIDSLLNYETVKYFCAEEREVGAL